MQGTTARCPCIKRQNSEEASKDYYCHVREELTGFTCCSVVYVVVNNVHQIRRAHFIYVFKRCYTTLYNLMNVDMYPWIEDSDLHDVFHVNELIVMAYRSAMITQNL